MSADIFGSFTSETQRDLPEQSSFQAHPPPPNNCPTPDRNLSEVVFRGRSELLPTSPISPAPPEVLPVSPFHLFFILGFS